MDTLVGRIKTNPLADGFDEILMPGEIESRLEAERRKTGIPFAAADLALLAKLASDHGVAELPKISR
jgi:LDH2 family malate/lactate/ureidoglycolate dehydrogenase